MNVYKKALESCNRYKGGVCTEEEKDVSIVERRERRSARVPFRTTEEGIYQIFKATSNVRIENNGLGFYFIFLYLIEKG